MLRLHLLPETPAAGPAFACAEIRLLRPWNHPSLKGRVEVSAGHQLPAGERLHAVVLQRAGPFGAGYVDLLELLREVRSRRIPLIYDLDDDLLTWHASATVEREIEKARPAVRLLLREADLVVVPTKALAARVAPLNPAVAVWENAIDERLLLPEAESGRQGADLGYVGTRSHLADLLSVLEPVQAALAAWAALHDRPRVELCGVSADRRMASLLAHCADVVLRPVIDDYATFMRAMQTGPRWKLGLAPLLDLPFSHCKSDIKFLDYALFGIPGVYSDLPCYEAVVHGETGMKVPPQAFGAAVAELLDDASLRARVAAGARDYLMQRRTLDRCAPALLRIVETALDQAITPAAVNDSGASRAHLTHGRRSA